MSLITSGSRSLCRDAHCASHACNAQANFTKFTDSTLGSQSYSPSLLETFKPIGTHTAHICEATDAAWSSSAVIADGMSGDTEYPYGDIKVLATMGEYLPSTGYMLVGVPDGMGSVKAATARTAARRGR